MPIRLLSYNRRIKKRKQKIVDLYVYIDNLDILDQTSITNIFRFICRYSAYEIFNQGILLLLKYKFNYMPTLYDTKHSKGFWYRSIVDFVDYENEIIPFILSLSFNDKEIILLNKMIRYKNFEFEKILDYIMSNDKLIDIFCYMLTRLDTIDDKYINYFLDKGRKQIIKFNNKEQLFKFIDKWKFVDYILLTKNKDLFTNEELYNFLLNKPSYIIDVWQFIDSQKKLDKINLDLLSLTTKVKCHNIFKKKHDLFILLNKYPEYYNRINIIHFIEYNVSWKSTRFLRHICSYIDPNYVNHMGYCNGDFNLMTFSNLANSILNDSQLNKFFYNKEYMLIAYVYMMNNISSSDIECVANILLNNNLDKTKRELFMKILSILLNKLNLI
jgi:hypothetical protein